MKQMQGFIGQFVSDIKRATVKKYRKLQNGMSHENMKKMNQLIAKGSLDTENPNTIAMAIFNTFRSLCCRCSPALTDCSPGRFSDLSFKKMIM